MILTNPVTQFDDVVESTVERLIATIRPVGNQIEPLHLNNGTGQVLLLYRLSIDLLAPMGTTMGTVMLTFFVDLSSIGFPGFHIGCSLVFY